MYHEGAARVSVRTTGRLQPSSQRTDKPYGYGNVHRVCFRVDIDHERVSTLDDHHVVGLVFHLHQQTVRAACEFSARNLDGVELVSTKQVHPYHLLRYTSAVFSRAALEKLQDTLKATAPKRKQEVA